jgi:hypothetical protein
MLLGFALLFTTVSSSWAMPPRQHSLRGIVESIDQSTHTMTVAPMKGGQPLVFVWKDSTRFRQCWSRLCSGALQNGSPVKIYYRREIGQFVPREVNLQSDAAMSCAIGQCCGRRS